MCPHACSALVPPPPPTSSPGTHPNAFCLPTHFRCCPEPLPKQHQLTQTLQNSFFSFSSSLSLSPSMTTFHLSVRYLMEIVRLGHGGPVLHL